MPGRIVRGARAATGDGPALKPSRRTSTAVTGVVPDEGANTTLRRDICAIFSDAQKTTATHRKLIIKLRKLQESCCYEPVSEVIKNKSNPDEEFDEEDFNREIIRCILRILAVRKAEPAGDRVVRFLGSYLNSASAKDAEIAGLADPDATILAETPTARLTTQLLEELLRRLDVKDKAIRFRATQITSHIINSLDALDDTLFHRLRVNLLKRIYDKEAPVRLQAVYGLGRLAAESEENENDDDDDSENDGGAGVLKKLLNVLQNDPSAEVRRNLLLNLPLTKEVLPYLLERARDADGQTRRALYARLLPALGDFRHLSLTHREKLLRWGLRDRDENVRKATGKLFRERWIEDCAALPAAQAAEQAQEGAENEDQNQRSAKQAADPSLDALLELLERIDVVNSGGEGGIALVAMKEFWEGRPDYVDYVSFPDEFWQDLNPELAFVARTFNDHCRAAGAKAVHGLAAMAEEKLPELTKFGFYLERSMNKLIETVHAAALGDEEAEEDAPQAEFVVEQLLHMALLYDYSDEVGRRKIFALMREALALADLPEECTRLVVEVLRLVCGESARGEADFCTVVLEAVAEVHDVVMNEDESSVDESFHSATSHVGDEGTPQPTKPKAKKRNDSSATETERENAMREIMVNMKCLHIALCMLQNVACDLEGNVHLVTMLNNLVVPAVRSQEAPIRERGLLCLGLCCLLGKVCISISDFSSYDTSPMLIHDTESRRRKSDAFPPLFCQRPPSPPSHSTTNHRGYPHHPSIPPRRSRDSRPEPINPPKRPETADHQSLQQIPQIRRRKRSIHRRGSTIQNDAQPTNHRYDLTQEPRSCILRPRHTLECLDAARYHVFLASILPQPGGECSTDGRSRMPRSHETVFTSREPTRRR